MITKLQQNFVFRGFGDKLVETTFGAVRVCEIAKIQKTHTFLLYAYIYANKMKMQSLKKKKQTRSKNLKDRLCFADKPQLHSNFALPFFYTAVSHQYTLKWIACSVHWPSRDDLPKVSHLLQTTLNSAQISPTLLFLLCSKEVCRHALQFLLLPGKSYFP